MPRYGFLMGTGCELPAGPMVTVAVALMGDDPIFASGCCAAEVYIFPAVVAPAGYADPGASPRPASSRHFGVIVPVTVAVAVCVCAGICVVSRVTVSVPDTSPSDILLSPGPWPVPTGTRDLRS